MISHVIVDPYVIALPLVDEQRDASAYLEGLIRWANRLRTSDVLHTTPERCVENMIATGAFPTLQCLKEFIYQKRVTGISAVDVANCVRSIADRRPYTEDAVNVHALLRSDDCIVAPAAVIDRLNTPLAGSFADCLFAVVVSDANNSENVAVGTIGLADKPREIMLNGTVASYERADRTVLDNIAVSSQIALLHDEDYDAEEDAAVEWCEVYGNVTEVVSAALRELHRRPEFATTKCTDISYGSEFVSSIQKLGLHQQAPILKRIFVLAVYAGIGIIARISGAKLHPVRKSKAADADQMLREDGAKLWRCMVTQKGAGFRLHYWSLVDGRIELDRILVESEV